MRLDPLVLFFLLGLFAGLVRSDLKLPAALYDTLSVFLLLAIGIKGGLELATQSSLAIVPQAALVLAMGFAIPCLLYPALRWRLSQPDAASVAAHYGSVSVVTFAVGVAFLTRRGEAFESQTTLFLVLLEMPALIMGVLLSRLGRKAEGKTRGWGNMLREVFLGKSVVLLLGGMLIGVIAGPEGIKPLDRLYLDLFKPALTLFLLEMGLIVAANASTIRAQGWFLVATGILLPLVLSWVGIGVGLVLGLSRGGVTMLAILAASASYIAAPAAMRMAVPQANPALSLGAALGITFPFNLIFGIPLYHRCASWLVAS
jgi:hypothetical protein